MAKGTDRANEPDPVLGPAHPPDPARLSVVLATVPDVPSHLHETLVEMFRRRPTLAADLLVHGLGVELPAFDRAGVDAGELPDLTPTEYRADAVVVLGTDAGPALAVVVEVQLGRDQGKRWTWPVYVTTLRARMRCPTVLLVVCVDAATAAWCAVPIELGHPASRVAPLVLGPDRVPVVGPAAALDAPELAVLSAMAHGGDPERARVLDVLPDVLAALEEPHASMYLDVVLSALPEAARRYLEALMASGTYEYQSDFARRYFFQGRAEGEAQGEAKAVLAVLDARGIAVDEASRAAITGCTDLGQLDVWVRRAVTVASARELFD